MKRALRIGAVTCGGLVVVAGAACIAVVQLRAGREHTVTQPPVWTPPADLPSAPPATPSKPSVLPSPSTEPLVAPATIAGTARIDARVTYSLAVKQRVVFVTIDDGNVRDPRVRTLIEQTHLPVSAFLIENAVNVDPAFWQSMAGAGVRIENHTVSHPRMTSLGLSAQETQICSPEPRYAGLFGRRPAFFRPPYGAWNATTLAAADHCGIGAVFLWDATYGGGVLATWGGRPLQPGDIILMHFLNTTYDDLIRLMRMLRADNLGVGLLEDYVHVGASSPSPTASASPSSTHSPTSSPSASPSPTPSQSPSSSPSPSPSDSPTPTPSPSETPSARGPGP